MLNGSTAGSALVPHSELFPAMHAPFVPPFGNPGAHEGQPQQLGSITPVEKQEPEFTPVHPHRSPFVVALSEPLAGTAVSQSPPSTAPPESSQKPEPPQLKVYGGPQSPSALHDFLQNFCGAKQPTYVLPWF